MTNIVQWIAAGIAAILLVFKYFEIRRGAKNEVKYKNLEEEINGIEDKRKINNHIDNMPASTVNNLLRLFVRNKKQ